jgi:alanine-synthesizing transaminase
MSDRIRHDFSKLLRLPPYVLAEVTELRHAARRAGEDVIDLGMGNPDLPTPDHVVDKICEAARNERNHRYSSSRGVPNLRASICEWYQRRHGVELDPDGEAIAVIGAKEGLSHFVLVTVGPGDVVLAPDPTYPIHQYSVIIAGGDLRHVPMTADTDFIANLEQALHRTWPRPKLLILSFPHNPTTQCVDRAFFERIVGFAREHHLMVIHDFAYAEICFDGYKPPSILEVPGARDVAIEFISLSKSHSMAGWRRRATPWRAGEWASPAATARWCRPSPASRATSTTASPSQSRSAPSWPCAVPRTASRSRWTSTAPDETY